MLCFVYHVNTTVLVDKEVEKVIVDCLRFFFFYFSSRHFCLMKMRSRKQMVDLHFLTCV